MPRPDFVLSVFGFGLVLVFNLSLVLVVLIFFSWLILGLGNVFGKL